MTPDEVLASEQEISNLDTELNELRKLERQCLDMANAIRQQQAALRQQHNEANAKGKSAQLAIDAKQDRRNQLFQELKRHKNAERAKRKEAADRKRAEEEAKLAQPALAGESNESE